MMQRILQFAFIGGLFLSVIAVGDVLASCDAVSGFDYRGTPIHKLPNSRAYFYVVSRMAIDADGAPNAYHPQDKGIDALANAGFPRGNWKAILVPDPRNPSTPFIQTEGEFAGFFVAKTALQDPSLPATDIRRYVDSRRVPYVVFPGAFHNIEGTGTPGDMAAALNLDTNQESPGIVADIGPRNALLGEVSIRLAENLGGSHVNPCTGAGIPRGRFAYLVFPRTKASPAWPVGSEELQDRVRELLTGIGGWERVTSCIQNR
jgi:Fungal chitosanase of glycosyl hydrolase group 75